MSAPADVHALLAALRETIAAARQVVAGNAVIDLAGFEGDVAHLCRAATALPPADRSSAADALRALIGELDDLAADLKAQCAGLSHEASPRRAAEAYGSKPPASSAGETD